MTFNFNSLNYIENYRDNWKKNINPITFFFVEEGPGRGSEDIEEEYNVNCFDFPFSSVFLMLVMVGKGHSQLNKTALKQTKKKHMHSGKALQAP